MCLRLHQNIHWHRQYRLQEAGISLQDGQKCSTRYGFWSTLQETITRRKIIDSKKCQTFSDPSFGYSHQIWGKQILCHWSCRAEPLWVSSPALVLQICNCYRRVGRRRSWASTNLKDFRPWSALQSLFCETVAASKMRAITTWEI